MLGPWLRATIELAFLRFVADDVVETLIECRPGLVCVSLVLVWWISKVLERFKIVLDCLLGEDFADCAADEVDLLDECLMEDVDEVAEEDAMDEEDSCDLESH